MKLSAEAMNAALNDFTTVQFSTKKVSLYESLLVGAWLRANNRYPDPPSAPGSSLPASALHREEVEDARARDERFAERVLIEQREDIARAQQIGLPCHTAYEGG